MVGSSWFLKRSRHCLPLRPLSCAATIAHLRNPCSFTSRTMSSSSSDDHGRLSRTEHCVTVRNSLHARQPRRYAGKEQPTCSDGRCHADACGTSTTSVGKAAALTLRRTHTRTPATALPQRILPHSTAFPNITQPNRAHAFSVNLTKLENPTFSVNFKPVLGDCAYLCVWGY